MSTSFKAIIGQKVYSATYLVDGNILTVTSKFGTKRAVIGVAQPLALAKALLRAMIRTGAQSGLPIKNSFVRGARLKAAAELSAAKSSSHGA